MRPVDWSPLADSDPVPGDPVSLRELANQLIAVAQTISDQNSRMAELDAGEIWDSDAAVTFTEMQETLPPDLEIAAGRYDGVANALYTYADALGDAQSLADGALSRAQEAQADLDAANSGIQDMEDWADQAQTNADTTNEANPDAPPVEPEEWSGPDHYALRDDANERIDTARDDLESAVDARDEAASTAESSIEEASDTPHNNPGFWESALLVVADVLSIAGAVLGVLSIFFPVLAPLALIVGVASLLLNSGLAMAGAKSWTDAMWDAIGLATFGAGRLFSLGSRLVRSGRVMTRMNSVAGRMAGHTSTLGSAQAGRAALLGRSSLQGLRATSANGTTLYGAAARSRLLSQFDSTIAASQRGLRVTSGTHARLTTQYNAIRYPTTPAWPGWSGARGYVGNALRDGFSPLSLSGMRADNGLGALGTVVDLSGTIGVGTIQVDGAINNMQNAPHWEGPPPSIQAPGAPGTSPGTSVPV